MAVFEEGLERLEKIAELMRDSAVPLEEVMALFEEGNEIAKNLEKELKGYELKVDKLVNLPDVQGGDELEIEPFEPEEK
ncbi:MAG: exodeoxyribonuclease VII small subunit [spirochete symbiont of Stewartia floridana]|nr:MAG: exodeoxyribonuclease VII small subunit [spirochete symbiont of Stewartia floridana]